MVTEEKMFRSLFYDLQKCYSLIHDLDLSRKKGHPIIELSEAFSLCSGAFFNLCIYYKYYEDLLENSQNENEESWNIFHLTDNYQTFLSDFLPPSDMIKLDFRWMCIANAAFRLSAAGVLLCDVIQKIHLTDCEIGLSKWPYQQFFNVRNCDWNRKKIHPNNCFDIIGKTGILRNLSLLIALRDEYGHSEFQETHKCRALIRDNCYKEHIIPAEIEMLQKCVALIHYLYEIHKRKLKRV